MEYRELVMSKLKGKEITYSVFEYFGREDDTDVDEFLESLDNEDLTFVLLSICDLQDIKDVRNEGDDLSDFYLGCDAFSQMFGYEEFVDLLLGY